MVLEVGNSGDGGSDADTVVQRSSKPCVSTAAGSTGHSDPVCVDLGTGTEVIKGSNAIPGFYTGRGITSGIPPPHPISVGAVMDPHDFSQLNGVDEEADVAVAGKPDSVVLVVGFVATADAMDNYAAVATSVKDGWGRLFEFLRTIKVGGDIEMREGLEVEFFHDDAVSFDSAGNDGMEWGSWWLRIQAEHFTELTLPAFPLGFPILCIADATEPLSGLLSQTMDFVLKVLSEHSVTWSRLFRQGPSPDRRGHQQAQAEDNDP